SSNGSFAFKDEHGATQFVIPAPIMWDSSGQADSRPPATYPLAASIAQQDDGTWQFTLMASYAWLADPDRVYPVHVDPTSEQGWWAWDAVGYKINKNSVTVAT